MQSAIDAVFTWVDGNDPSIKAKRISFSHELKKPGTLSGAADLTRFRDSGELFFAVSLVRENAPWLRRIHIVTDNQKPSWCSDQVQKDFGINFVDHKEIFRGYEEFLPTFSSRSIESKIHKIPGLSELFIYFNDDVFVIKKVVPGDYFTGTCPLVRGNWTWNNRLLAYIERKWHVFSGEKDWLKGSVGKRKESEVLGYWRYFRSAHTPHPINKQLFENYFADEGLIKSIIQYRFRNYNQIWPIGYFTNRALKEGKAIVHQKDWEYLSPEMIDRHLQPFFENINNRPEVKHLCIQSLDQFPDKAKEMCLDFFANL